MSTTAKRPARQPKQAAPDLHRPGHARYIGVQTDHETGRRRLRWDCPSKSSPGKERTLLTDEDGGNPWCSCPGYDSHGHCGLTEAADELVARDRPDLVERVKARRQHRHDEAMRDLFEDAP